MSTKALEGCRVLEISHAAGAVAGRVLTDLGAEVIKIEPLGGEAARKSAPTVTLRSGEEISLFWLAFNVSKKSFSLDLSSAADIAEFQALARSADIVITDFERLSIAEADCLYDLAMQVAPSLVWTDIWPYGRGKPYETYPATDLVLQAAGGHLFLNGDADRPPVRLGLPVALMQGGAEAASAALMAWYHKLRTGEGQRVDISIQECIVWTLLNTTMAWQLLALNEMRGGAVRKERANRFFTRQVWPCADGFVFFGPVGGGGGAAREKSYAALLEWMAEDGLTDPILTAHDWNGPKQFEIPQAAYDEVTSVISAFIATKTTDDLMSRAVAQRILLAPVASIQQVLDSPHLSVREFFAQICDETRGFEARYPAHWVRMTKTPLRALSPAPQPDADGVAIRAELRQLKCEARTA